MRGWVTKWCTEMIANDIMKSIIVSNLRANAKKYDFCLISYSSRNHDSLWIKCYH